MKKLVYSVLLGEYDELRSFNRQIGWDYYLFTDIVNINKSNWTILPIPEDIKNLNISMVKKQRFLKLHPHLYFKNYTLSIYIDASFKITGDLDEFLIRTLSYKHDMYTLEHPERNTILNETFAVIYCRKEKKEMSELIREKYKYEGFPDNNGLIESCLIIRKHNQNKVIKLMNSWYSQIKNYSHRDQLSFNYVLWKTGLKIKYISKYFAYFYFHQNLFHLK